MKGEVSVSVRGRATAATAGGRAATTIAIAIAFVGSVKQPDHSLNFFHNRLGFDD